MCVTLLCLFFLSAYFILQSIHISHPDLPSFFILKFIFIYYLRFYANFIKTELRSNVCKIEKLGVAFKK
jgi:hypothetical protein